MKIYKQKIITTIIINNVIIITIYMAWTITQVLTLVKHFT